jgi:hypothetical protein
MTDDLQEVELPPLPPFAMQEKSPYSDLGAMDPYDGKPLLEWYTAAQMRAYGLECYRAGMERAAVIAGNTLEAEFDGNDYYGERCAAAIRKEPT